MFSEEALARFLDKQLVQFLSKVGLVFGTAMFAFSIVHYLTNDSPTAIASSDTSTTLAYTTSIGPTSSTIVQPPVILTGTDGSTTSTEATITTTTIPQPNTAAAAFATAYSAFRNWAPNGVSTLQSIDSTLTNIADANDENRTGDVRNSCMTASSNLGASDGGSWARALIATPDGPLADTYRQYSDTLRTAMTGCGSDGYSAISDALPKLKQLRAESVARLTLIHQSATSFGYNDWPEALS